MLFYVLTNVCQKTQQLKENLVSESKRSSEHPKFTFPQMKIFWQI